MEATQVPKSPILYFMMVLKTVVKSKPSHFQKCLQSKLNLFLYNVKFVATLSLFLNNFFLFAAKRAISKKGGNFEKIVQFEFNCLVESRNGNNKIYKFL